MSQASQRRNFLTLNLCTLVVNRGQPTPNHVITRPLLLTHHHTNSAPAHLVLSTTSPKVCIYAAQPKKL